MPARRGDVRAADVRRTTLELYRAIDCLCLTMAPAGTSKRHLRHYVAYSYRDCDFCWIRLRRRAVSVAVRLTSGRRRSKTARRRSKTAQSPGPDKRGSWKDVVVLSINRSSQLDATAPLIRRAFDGLSE